MQKQRGLQTMRHCKGMRDLRQQQLIRHTSGEGSVFQKLDRIAREREILLARARLWATNFRQEEERIAELDRERGVLIRGLETLVSPSLEQRHGD
jgi:hypothetical protein